MADILNILWKQQLIGEGWDVEADLPIWISVADLNAAWCNGEDFIGPAGTGSSHADRYARFGEFFRKAEFVTMPTGCFDEHGAVSFTNGRHRFAWLRDHGLTALPIEVPKDQAEMFKVRFGTVEQIGAVL